MPCVQCASDPAEELRDQDKLFLRLSCVPCLAMRIVVRGCWRAGAT